MWAKADELFECVWPLCGVGAWKELWSWAFVNASYMFHVCLKEYYFPDCWKIASVAPVHLLWTLIWEIDNDKLFEYLRNHYFVLTYFGLCFWILFCVAFCMTFKIQVDRVTLNPTIAHFASRDVSNSYEAIILELEGSPLQKKFS